MLNFLRYLQKKLDADSDKRSSTQLYFGTGAVRSLKNEIKESRKKSHLFTNQSIDVISRIQSSGKRELVNL